MSGNVRGYDYDRTTSPHGGGSMVGLFCVVVRSRMQRSKRQVGSSNRETWESNERWKGRWSRGSLEDGCRLRT
jgi:hypothetical protein